MPTAPRRHRAPRTTKQHDTRPSAHDRGYGRDWRKARAAFLMISPLCEPCRRKGKTTPAQDVDHIIPISQGGERLDFDNLQSICRKCHNHKTHGHGHGKGKN